MKTPIPQSMNIHARRSFFWRTDTSNRYRQIAEGVFLPLLVLFLSSMYLPVNAGESSSNEETVVKSAPLRRPISSTTPLFLFRSMVYKANFTVDAIWPTIPPDIQPFSALELYFWPSTDKAGRNLFDEQLTICDQRKIFAIPQIGNGWEKSGIDDLAWVEKMYRKHPYMLGIMFSELLGRKYDQVANMINLSAKYGGYCMNTDFNQGKP